MSTSISLNDPTVRSYLFYSSILCLKMLIMSILTAKQRFRKGAFANPEDAIQKGHKVKRDDEDVERVRRAHLNDLENIPVFLVAAGLYTLTGPTPAIAINLFRAFTAARIVHTLVYAVVVIPQPSRALSWGIGYGITAYLLVQNILYFA